jgi:hypothetical protein
VPNSGRGMGLGDEHSGGFTRHLGVIIPCSKRWEVDIMAHSGGEGPDSRDGADRQKGRNQ